MKRLSWSKVFLAICLIPWLLVGASLAVGGSAAEFLYYDKSLPAIIFPGFISLRLMQNRLILIRDQQWSGSIQMQAAINLVETMAIFIMGYISLAFTSHIMGGFLPSMYSFMTAGGVLGLIQFSRILFATSNQTNASVAS